MSNSRLGLRWPFSSRDSVLLEGHGQAGNLDAAARLIQGEQDLVLGAGEAAEFDTQTPHWFGSTGDEPAEVLSIFGRPGERIHVHAPSRAT